MAADPTRRFSSRVEEYIRFRPGYPGALIDLLRRECALTRESRVADIGSGTGILSEMLLAFGCDVTGVEPNDEMRQAGDRLLASWPRFRSVSGRAEHTGLPAASLNLVTAAQAFHWFDPVAAQAEFRRILRPGGRLALIWNERLVEGAFLEGYEALLRRYCPEYAEVDHRRIDAKAMDSFFGAGTWQEAWLPNQQDFDLAGLLGRLDSSSYAPQQGASAYLPLRAEMTSLFEQSQHAGTVAFLYETRIWWGGL
jgi:SAM-dependent methyltransferase